MKHLELFKQGFDSTLAEKVKVENWPYIGYDVVNDLVKFSTIPSQEETVGIPGYVDLGLSVMWASCDVGATSPEGEGTKYAWGETSWDTIPLEFDPVYMNSDMEEWKKVLRPRTPSPDQVKELLDNTTATEEVLNGVSGVRYTASNGNSIFVSNIERWTNAEMYKVNVWSSYEAVCWNPSSGIIDNTGLYNGATQMKSEYTMKEYYYPFRGVCSNVPQGGAILLEHDKTVQADANTLYCFHSTWWETATEFTVQQGNTIQMFVSTSGEFTASVDDPNVIAVHDFAMVEGQRTLQLSSYEMGVITSQATSDYLYVRFLVDAPMQITPTEWVTSSCLDKSYLITPNTEFAVAAKSSSKIFRARYSDFSNYDLTIKWTGASTLPTYIAETCDFSLSNNNAALLIKGFSISRKGTKVIDAATVDAWEPRIPEEGFFFVRFNPNNQGKVTFETAKPQE